MTVDPDLLLSGIEFQSFFLYQIVHHFNGFHIFGGVEAGVLLVAFGLDDSEFFFPEAQSGSRNAENLGHFADLVVVFRQIFHDNQSIT